MEKKDGKVWYVDRVTGAGHWMDEKYAELPDSIKGGKVYSAETRTRISKALTGKPLSAEHRQNIGRAGRGIKHTAEQNAAKSVRMKGVKRGPASDETKAKISAANKGRKRGSPSAEYRAKISAAKILKSSLTQEQRQAIAEDERSTKEIARDYGVLVGRIQRIKRKFREEDRND